MAGTFEIIVDRDIPVFIFLALQRRKGTRMLDVVEVGADAGVKQERAVLSPNRFSRDKQKESPHSRLCPVVEEMAHSHTQIFYDADLQAV